MGAWFKVSRVLSWALHGCSRMHSHPYEARKKQSQAHIKRNNFTGVGLRFVIPSSGRSNQIPVCPRGPKGTAQNLAAGSSFGFWNSPSAQHEIVLRSLPVPPTEHWEPTRLYAYPTAVAIVNTLLLVQGGPDTTVVKVISNRKEVEHQWACAASTTWCLTCLTVWPGPRTSLRWEPAEASWGSWNEVKQGVLQNNQTFLFLSQKLQWKDVRAMVFEEPIPGLEGVYRRKPKGKREKKKQTLLFFILEVFLKHFLANIV